MLNSTALDIEFCSLLPIPSTYLHIIHASSQSKNLEVVVAKVGGAHHLTKVSNGHHIWFDTRARFTAIGPVPQTMVLPAEFRTWTDTVSVVMLENENAL